MFRGSLWLAVAWLLQANAAASELPFPSTATYAASDTLAPQPDASLDARECLAGLTWMPTEFDVECGPGLLRRGDLAIRFPSPVPSGRDVNDVVCMEWYLARNESGQPIKAPAVVVVHESGSGMTVGRLIARGLHVQGVHAFLIHLPHYGERREGEKRPRDVDPFTAMRQAIADVRRARDAVAVLPMVDDDCIALQGTSLGGFVCATTASLDDGYDRVFLLLAGGKLFDLVQNGERDAAKVREELARGGLSGDKLKALLETIEPTRLAHRLDPSKTWLYSATYDTVVPMKNAQALADAAGLEGDHHIRMAADHYSGIVYLPMVLAQIAERTKAAPVTECELVLPNTDSEYRR